MKSKILSSYTLILCVLVLSWSFKAMGQTQELPDKMAWWKDAKFGMFIHWGLYSKTAGYWKGQKAKGSEHFMLYERIPWKEYAKIADDFNPVKFDADKWVLTAKNAGMKYLVITSKHHDGFSMYDSPSSDYNIMERTPFERDPMKELAEACHKYGIKFGFYYSLGRDWQDPDVPTNWPVKGARSNTWDYPNEDDKVFNKYFERKVKPQVKELLTQYGEIDILWFDTPAMISKEESQELRSLITSIQPNCIINQRIGNGLGDYRVAEQEIIEGIQNEPWESCITMGKNWGYIEYDKNYKSSELMIRQLLEIVSKGGNLLLNNGPTAEGEITHLAQERLEKIGYWMNQNSEGIYGASPWNVPNELLADSLDIISQIESTKKQKLKDAEGNTMIDAENDATSRLIFPEIRFTTKNDLLYAYACSYSGEKLIIKSVPKKDNLIVKSVSRLGTNQEIKWNQSDEGLQIEMPEYSANEIPITGFRIKFY